MIVDLVARMRERLSNYDYNREHGAYAGVDGYFNIDDIHQLVDRLAAAERVVDAARSVEPVRDFNWVGKWRVQRVVDALAGYEKAYFSDPDVVPDSPAVQGYHDPSLWEDGPADLNSAKQEEAK